MKIYIKNMACESCKVIVREALEELDITPIKVELGEIETREEVTNDQKMQLNRIIKKVGLELLERKQGLLIEKIRKIMIEYVYKSDEKPNIKFSVLLSEELNYSYTYLANFFLRSKLRPLNNLLLRSKSSE